MVVLLILIAGCFGLGVLATFEPGPASVQWTFRLIYGGALIACLSGAGWLLVSGGRPRQ